MPTHAVTFLDNHDTGSTQGHWQKPRRVHSAKKEFPSSGSKWQQEAQAFSERQGAGGLCLHPHPPRHSHAQPRGVDLKFELCTRRGIPCIFWDHICDWGEASGSLLPTHPLLDSGASSLRTCALPGHAKSHQGAAAAAPEGWDQGHCLFECETTFSSQIRAGGRQSSNLVCRSRPVHCRVARLSLSVGVLKLGPGGDSPC